MLNETIEILQLLREPPLGRLVVRMNGRPYRRLDEIADAAARQRLLAAVGDLVGFAGGYQALADAGLAPLPPGHAQSSPGGASGTTNAQAAFLASLSRETAGHNAVNFVDQINDILQELIIAEPRLASRSISLRQSASGRLLVELDGEYYRQPSDVPDPQVQDVIRRALKRWDAS